MKLQRSAKNGEFCEAVGHVPRTAGILAVKVNGQLKALPIRPTWIMWSGFTRFKLRQLKGRLKR